MEPEPLMRPARPWLMVTVLGAGTVAVAAAAPLGWWWAGVVVGVAVGALLRGRAVVLEAVVVGLLGWGLPLVGLAIGGDPVGQTAYVLGVILGFPSALVGVGVTLLLSVAFCVAGAWLGSSLRSLLALGRSAA